MASTLSRSQFDQACKAYVDAHSNDYSDVKRYPSGWIWEEHPVRCSKSPLETPCLIEFSISPASAFSREPFISPPGLSSSLNAKMKMVWLS